MKTRYRSAITLCLFLVTLALSNCSDEEADTRTSKKSNTLWAEGFPKIRAGAVTLDFDMQPAREAEVFYLVSTSPLSLTREQLIAQAKAPTHNAIIRNGALSLAPDERRKETITGLKQKAKYYAYLVAADTAAGDADEWLVRSDVTMKVRQDTSQFYSAAESRNSYYLLYAPEDALKYPEEKYPIIYYMAGSGEASLPTRPINVARNGTLTQYLSRGNDVPMMVFTIQHITEEWNTGLVGDAVAFAKANLPVDINRQYLVGSSAGAFACWDYGLEHPEEFAAIVPISGGGKASLACNAKNMGVWAFHNQPDNKVAPSRSINMISNIRECGPAKEVKLDIFNDPGHNCWRRVFDPNHPDWEELSPDKPKIYLYDWLLTFSKSKN